MRRENREVDGHMRELRQSAHQIGEQSQPRVRMKELSAERIERGISGLLDPRHINRRIIDTEVVTLDRNGERRDHPQADDRRRRETRR